MLRAQELGATVETQHLLVAPSVPRTATMEWPAGGRPEVRRAARLWGKRILDLGLASVLIVLTSPALVLAMAAIRLTSRGPAIFRQPRVGFQGGEFTIFKLRTMCSDPPRLPSYPAGPAPAFESTAECSSGRIFEKIGNGDARVTPVGRVLRKLSLDELPQLFNVLRGEMSLVGPRPLLLADMRSFPEGRPMRRFDMKPGITGLWQVSGRSLLSDAERIRLDVEYVERWSPWMDFKILLRTPLAVLLARGAL